MTICFGESESVLCDGNSLGERAHVGQSLD